MHWWEYPAMNQNKITQPYDVGIVLSGGMAVNDPEMSRINFRSSTDRFLQALNLYKSKKIKKIMLVGGDARLFKNDEKESELLKKYMVLIGISDTDIIAETQSQNTYQNAIYSKKILLEKFPKGKYLLITSGYHIKRAKACFKKAGINVVPYSVDRRAGKTKHDFDFLFIPSVETLCSWNGLFHEWLGYFSYLIMGYI
ncbi:MAG: YdcF family protein [Bacteroidales bacterium]|nr:YdcF family protein [Bacteroidales bacterium]